MKPVFVFWNNWKTLTEFTFIDFSYQRRFEPTTFAIGLGLLGFGVVITWLEKPVKDEHDYYKNL